MILRGKDADKFIEQLNTPPSKDKLLFLEHCRQVYNTCKR